MGRRPHGLALTAVESDLLPVSAVPPAVGAVAHHAPGVTVVVGPLVDHVVNQWTDDNGHTWRVMSDGTNRWWNGTDWQKV